MLFVKVYVGIVIVAAVQVIQQGGLGAEGAVSDTHDVRAGAGGGLNSLCHHVTI